MMMFFEIRAADAPSPDRSAIGWVGTRNANIKSKIASDAVPVSLDEGSFS